MNADDLNNPDFEPRVLRKRTAAPPRSSTRSSAPPPSTGDEDMPAKRANVSPALKAEIRAKRVEKGWKQGEFAKKLSVPVSVVQSYENGTVPPDQKLIQKMQKVLGCRFTVFK